MCLDSIPSSFVLKALSENRLDAMDPGGDGTGRHPGDLADPGGIEVLEVQQNHLSVEGVQ